jgi:RNA recognition motif-containing protein
MKPVPMYRVYVGNLDSAVTEASLIDALRQEAFDPTAVVLKRGYAFVDFNDSAAFTEAIDQLNGRNYYKLVYKLVR